MRFVLRLRKGARQAAGLQLVASKTNPRVKRWQRVGDAPKKQKRAAAPSAPAPAAPAEPPKRAWVDALPHLPKDTLTAHTGPDGKITPQRAKLHEKILAHFLDGVTAPPAGQQPEALVMMGGPASGKTTATKHLNIDRTRFVNLNADDVKEELPEYNEAVAGSARNAAEMAHEESSMLMKQIRDKAIEQGKNLIMDGTGANKKGYVEFVQRLKSQGYHVTVIMPDLDRDTATQRAKDRAEKVGRHVPQHVIDSAYGAIPHNFIPIASTADDFHLYDARPFPPKPVWSKVDGAEQVHDPNFVAEFRKKFGGEEAMKKGRMRKGEQKRAVSGTEIQQIVERGFAGYRDEYADHKPRVNAPGDGVREVHDDAVVE